MFTLKLYTKPGLPAQLLDHLRTPLYRNGYALILGSGATSALGLVYWALAARYYTADVVGIGSALISALALLAGVAMLSLTGVLVRFTPLAGGNTARLITAAYAISLVVALLVGWGFCHFAGAWSPKFSFLREERGWLVAFVGATMAWCIFALQDSALTGLRQSLWIPLENTIFAAVKIVLLVLFAQGNPTWGIFAAWMIPLLISLLPVNILIFRYLIPQHVQPQGQQAGGLALQAVVRYMAGNYPGTLFYLASTTLLPLLVTQQLGARANAYFYMPWMMANALLQVALQMSTSLTVEAVTDQSRLASYAYRTFLQSARLLAPAVALLVGGAPLILALFGADYASEGALLLRLLAVATLPNLVVMLYIGLARVKNSIGNIILVQGAQCILLLSLSYLWLPTAGITAVGWAFLVSQSLVAGGVLCTPLRPIVLHGHRTYLTNQPTNETQVNMRSRSEVFQERGTTFSTRGANTAPFLEDGTH
ncbi:MAG: hypothetical protein R3E79_09320 [Caldilineaceae bacterium]